MRNDLEVKRGMQNGKRGEEEYFYNLSRASQKGLGKWENGPKLLRLP